MHLQIANSLGSCNGHNSFPDLTGRDICCGAHELACLMRQWLEKQGRHCRFIFSPNSRILMPVIRELELTLARHFSE